MPKPKQHISRAQRKRRAREVTLSEALSDRLDELSAAGANISAIAEEALRRHPEVNLPPEHDDP
jgi:post-segregation antitoxin (ccd killing protein)